MDISAKQTELSDPRKIIFAEIYIQTGSKWKAALAIGGEDLFEDFETIDLIREMKRALKEKALITLEGHLEYLALIRDEAMFEKKFSTALNAEIARGKVGGLYVERSNVNINHLSSSSTEELRRQLLELGQLLGNESPKLIETQNAEFAEFSKLRPQDIIEVSDSESAREKSPFRGIDNS